MITFEKYIETSVRWVQEHQERFWAIAGGTVLGILLIGLVIHHRTTENTDAWIQLGHTQSMILQGKFDEARKSLDSWQARYPRTSAATYAKFMKADLSYRAGDFAQASQIYGEISETGQPDVTKPLALSAQVDSEEMAGHIPQAQALAQSFLDRYPDHFLAAPRYMSQARLAELAGNPAAALAVYDRFILLFPQSPWTELARARTKVLGQK